jgi:amino acid adenylation domain-containing protein
MRQCRYGDDLLDRNRRELLARLADQRGIRLRQGHVPARRTADAPLSCAQQRLWFLHQVVGDGPLYNMAGAVRLRGPLDHTALSAAVNGLIRRHEALRTRFVTGPDGRPRQLVADAPRVDLVAERIDGCFDGPELPSVVRETACRPFDLSTGRLVRGRLLQAASDDHLLVIVVHHIVADGWSVRLLMEQLFGDYSARLAGRAPAVAAPEPSYADYAAWEADRMASPQAAEELDQWARQLQGLKPLGLLTDHVMSARPSFAGAVEHFTVSSAGGDRLREIAAEHRTTPYVVGLAGLAVLLSRWARQADVVIGAPFAGRTLPELSHVVGCFVNTLPVRLDVAVDQAFGDLVDQARERVLATQRHEGIPFDLLVERLRPEREPGGRNPVVRHVFGYQEQQIRPVEIGPLTATFQPLDTGTAKFDLSIELTPGEDGSLAGVVEYSADLLTAASVQRLISSFRALLGALDSAAPVGKLPLLSAVERDEVLRFGYGGRALAGDGQTVPEVIEAALDRWADRIVAVDDAEELSGAGLDRRANRLARRLREAGVGIETPVAVLLPGSIGLLVAALAVLKAGGGFVPLDPDHPAQRHADILRDAAAPVVVTNTSGALTADELPHGTAVIDLDAEQAQIARLSAGRLAPVARGGSIAYIIYTSGSDGRPKGAVNDHRALVNRLLWMGEAFPEAPGDAALHKTAAGFDVAIWELLWPLLVGARCVMAPAAARQDPGALARVITRYQVGTVHFVPSELDLFLAAGVARDCAGTLNRIVCSGEPLPPRLLDECAAQLPHTQVFNLYGPVEAAIDVSWHACAAAAARIPIGRPISGVRLYVVDQAGALAPVGMPGELWIGGIASGRGYHGRPGPTARQFAADSFAPAAEGGTRAYRTGDIVRWRPDGNLDHLGRADRQVKIRGMRIELGEIEAVLARHPGVRAAVAILRRGPAGGQKLVAWYQPTPGQAPGEESLQQYLSARLPPAMRPAALMAVPDWPRDPAGRIDVAALPEPRAAPVPPRDGIERRLVSIWAELLECPDVGVEDDFFGLGGHSLLAVQVQARVEESFGVEIPLDAILIEPTIAVLAREIRAARTGAREPL